MDVVRGEGVVTPGRRAEHTAQLDRLFEFLQGRSGPQAVTVTSPAGYPGTFTGITPGDTGSAFLTMIVVTTLLRFLGGGGCYLVGHGFITAEDAPATCEHPAIGRFRAENPLSAFTAQPVSMGVADVVETAVPAPVR